MATTGTVVVGLSRALDVPERIVALVVRRLVEGGMVRRGGRGPWAPHWNAEELAAAMFGVAAVFGSTERSASLSRAAVTEIQELAKGEPIALLSQEYTDQAGRKVVADYWGGNFLKVVAFFLEEMASRGEFPIRLLRVGIIYGGFTGFFGFYELVPNLTQPASGRPFPRRVNFDDEPGTIAAGCRREISFDECALAKIADLLRAAPAGEGAEKPVAKRKPRARRR